MAYQIILTEIFEESAARTSRWLESEWSVSSALKFEGKLLQVITAIGNNPLVGRVSAKRKNIRSIAVTRHNRIYYMVGQNTITILELIETKMDPRRNKYE